MSLRTILIVFLYCQAYSVWLEHTLQELPTESSGGAVTATKQQLADFHTLCNG